MSRPRLVLQPGIGSSGPDHWQSHWRRRDPGALWVEQADWDHPRRDAWVGRLLAVLREASGPKVLAAHSLGCLAAAEAGAALEGAGVVAAFLVAVPDATGPRFPPEAIGFRPALQLDLPVPSMVVASSDDPYGTLDHAQAVARRWGSALAPVGPKGHLNTASGLGAWEEGRALLDRFLDSLAAR